MELHPSAPHQHPAFDKKIVHKKSILLSAESYFICSVLPEHLYLLLTASISTGYQSVERSQSLFSYDQEVG